MSADGHRLGQGVSWNMTAITVRVRDLGTSVHWRFALVVALATLCVACGGHVEPELHYKPAFLPVEFTIDSKGISVEGDSELATPIGSFSIGAQYSLPQPNPDTIYVILRNRRTGFDRIFQVQSGGDQFMAVVNGTTSISITNNQVLIDVTNGKIKRIAFKRVSNQIAEGSQGSWLQRVSHAANARWDEGWKESWYKPYALTGWAYSDSTINKWYGIGFVWFLLRLVLAIVCAIIDTILSLGFLLGQAGFLIFGPTGRDVIYGLLVLCVPIVVVGIAMIAEDI
jgi:hypothetical protein